MISVCDDIINDTIRVTDRFKIPKTNLDMNLIGKELYHIVIINSERKIIG